MIDFSAQYRDCREKNLVGLNEGEEIELEMAFPNKAYRDYVTTHGKPPSFRASTCKRFGGTCSSGNKECKKLRASTPVCRAVILFNPLIPGVEHGITGQKIADASFGFDYVGDIHDQVNIAKHLRELADMLEAETKQDKDLI